MTERERTIEAMIDSVDNGDHETLRSLFADTVRYERPRSPVIEGAENMMKFFRERPIASGKHTPQQIIADDKRGAAWGTFRGKTRAGADIEVTWSDVFEFDEHGRICWRRSYVFDAG